MSRRKWPLIASLIALTSLSMSAGVRGGDEPKKEDEPKKAGKFEPIDITGTLDDTDPVDKVRNTPCKMHRVKLAKGKMYQIDMISTDFDTYLRLEDDKGKQLAQDDDGGGNLNVRIKFKATADGDYQIIATAFNGTGNYQLKVAETEAKPLKAKALKVGDDGTTVQDKLDNNDERGTIPPNTFQKIYSVKAKAGEVYTIDMESTDFDAFLHVLDDAEARLASDDDSGGNLNARIVFRPQADGTYYIVATGLGNPQGEYSLKIRKEEK